MLISTVALLAALAVDPCTLVTKAEAAAVTGKAPATALAYGPEKDAETKAVVSHCVMSGAPVGMIVLMDTHATPAAALAVTTAARIKTLMDDDVTVEPEPGVGDRAFWAHNDSSARMVVIRGAMVVTIVVGGIDLTKAGAKRPAIRAAAIRALTRL